MTQLSPAAQAVLDAVCVNTEPDCDTQHVIAAALRALADQVVPDDKPSSFISGAPQAFAMQRRTTRREILAISDELDNIQ